MFVEEGQTERVEIKFNFFDWTESHLADISSRLQPHPQTNYQIIQTNFASRDIMADSLSIEATNKVRASLGLSLLPVPGGKGGAATTSNQDAETSESEGEEPGSTLESRQAEGYDNWKQAQKQAADKKSRQDKVNAIKKARDEAQRKSKLEGKGLGEADDGEDLSARNWLKNSSKRQKNVEKEREKVRKIEQELREREEREYTAKDLAGLKVAHQAGDFDIENGEQILTLKDATIEENEEEGDELENIDLAEKARLNERLDAKKRKAVYNPMDDLDGESKMLQQYDEVINGKKRKHFTLNGEGDIDQDEDMDEVITLGKAKKAISLDILKELPSSDYQELPEVKMKKMKKKKTKNARQRVLEEDDDIVVPTNNQVDTNSMDLDTLPRPAKRQKDESFDDEDLQLSLARQRRATLKQRKKTRPEDLADQIRQEEAEAIAAPDIKMEEDEEGGLVIDETSEFISNLQLPDPERPLILKQESRGSNDEGDVDMTGSHNDDLESGIKREGSEGIDTGLGQELTVGSGVAAALSLARDRGLIQGDRDGETNEDTRRRNLFLMGKQKIERDVDDWARKERERQRESAEWKRMSIRDQEARSARLNEERDRRKSDLLSQLMQREYRPAVHLRYVDDEGRNMTPKEAFKAMSHAFHGKGSGKQKTEKRLKKIEDEKQRDARNVLDSGASIGMNNAASATAKKNRQPGVRLA